MHMYIAPIAIHILNMFWDRSALLQMIYVLHNEYLTFDFSYMIHNSRLFRWPNNNTCLIITSMMNKPWYPSPNKLI